MKYKIRTRSPIHRTVIRTVQYREVNGVRYGYCTEPTVNTHTVTGLGIKLEV